MQAEIKDLLSLNHLLAGVRDKNDLLQVINEHLRKLVYFSYSTTLIISEDRQTFSMFLLDPASLAGHHPAYQAIVENRHPVDDGIFDRAIRSDEPLIFNVEKLRQESGGHYPAYVKMFYETGIREVVTAALQNNKEKFGLLAMYSDKVNTFTPSQLSLIKGIASLVSIAVSNIIAGERIRKRELEKEMLLSLSYEMATIRDEKELLTMINIKLRKLFNFTHSSISAINNDRHTFRIYITDPQSQSKRHPDYIPLVTSCYPIHDGVFECFLQTEEPVVSDYEKVMLMEAPPRYAVIQHEAGLREAVSIRLMGENDCWGVLHFYSDSKNTFTADILPLIKGVASQVAVAVSNIIATEGLRVREAEKEALLALSHEMAKIRDKNELLSAINTSMKDLFYFTHSSIAAINDDRETFTVFLTDPGSRSKDHPDFIKMITARYPVNDGIFNKFLETDEPTVSDIEKNASFDWAPRYTKIHYEAGLREAVSIPMYGDKEVFGILTFYSDKKKSFTSDNLSIIKGVANQVAVAVSNILAHERIIRQLEEINRYRQQLEQENLYLQQQINTVYNYSEIVGSGPALQQVYRLLSQVSFANSTVLIMGETGTGKELIARAIHNASPRADKLMIKVNCAALPANLIESELFGHERGSFTGATERRIGKFELANNSTLFLDEIGELPLELQVKLLRALQEKEIERVGGKSTIKVNVRIIAATNRNLQQEVNKGNFRSDLYYRLNVFPIVMPPLREHKEDLPQLVAHFIERYARNAGKKIKGVSARVMKEMMAYHWPGNVRELEHLIERSVLLTEGPTIKAIHLPVDTLPEDLTEEDRFRVKTIDEVEREYIMSILSRCNGKVQGIGGAAELLNIPPTTLHSKMKKLGISKKHYIRED